MIRLRLSSLGMPAVLIALCAFFTWSTWTVEAAAGERGGRAAGALWKSRPDPSGKAYVVGGLNDESRAFAEGVRESLNGRAEVHVILGTPSEARTALLGLVGRGSPPRAILATPDAGAWAIWPALRAATPELRPLRLITPPHQGRSAFLSSTNLRNVADQISVIAILAVGMTLVIITGGIDLSVGSLVALSAVAAAWVIRAFGGERAGIGAMALASLASITAAGLIGALSGGVITRFRVPPFIATLAVMQVASGLAFIASEGQTIYAMPQTFTHLGRGNALAAMPNAVLIMLALYAAAHLLMNRTIMGRRIYAVGGNPEAARLSGVQNARTLLFVYTVSGLTAGIGGVITASQLKAGSPTYGVMYELYAIAAVVVGGTSLSGGQGRVFGTLVGAFIIAVIRNGMNLMSVEPYTQKVILGLVILGAVLVDQLRRRH